MGYFYIFGTIFFTVYGQLILKWRINYVGSLPDGLYDKIIFLVKLLFDPWIFSGFFAAFVASFFLDGCNDKIRNILCISIYE